MKIKAAILTASILLSGCAQEQYEEEKLAVVGQFLFTPKGITQLPSFAYLTIKSWHQAKTTPGNLYASISLCDWRACTLTVWDNIKSLKAFSQHGYHAEALENEDKWGQGRVTYFYTKVKPTWAEARIKLNSQHGVSHGR